MVSCFQFISTDALGAQNGHKSGVLISEYFEVSLKSIFRGLMGELYILKGSPLTLTLYIGIYSAISNCSKFMTLLGAWWQHVCHNRDMGKWEILWQGLWYLSLITYAWPK